MYLQGEIRWVLLLLLNKVPLITTGRIGHVLVSWVLTDNTVTLLPLWWKHPPPLIVPNLCCAELNGKTWWIYSLGLPHRFRYLPPRMGSAPWAAKSRPYKLSPSRIFCLHWAVGASWRMQSLTQGRGALGPGLSKQNVNKTQCHHSCCHCWKNSFTSLWPTLHCWNNRTSSGWIRRRRGPTLQTPPDQTCLAVQY